MGRTLNSLNRDRQKQIAKQCREQLRADLTAAGMDAATVELTIQGLVRTCKARGIPFHSPVVRDILKTLVEEYKAGQITPRLSDQPIACFGPGREGICTACGTPDDEVNKGALSLAGYENGECPYDSQIDQAGKCERFTCAAQNRECKRDCPYLGKPTQLH